MTWIIRLLLLLLLVLFLVRMAWRFLESVVDGASGGARRRNGVPSRGRRMVRDPICGTFVVQSRALTAASGGETAWFCSEECRRQWQRQRR